jgi:hypothetical protein
MRGAGDEHLLCDVGDPHDAVHHALDALLLLVSRRHSCAWSARAPAATAVSKRPTSVCRSAAHYSECMDARAHLVEVPGAQDALQGCGHGGGGWGRVRKARQHACVA